MWRDLNARKRFGSDSEQTALSSPRLALQALTICWRQSAKVRPHRQQLAVGLGALLGRRFGRHNASLETRSGGNKCFRAPIPRAAPTWPRPIFVCARLLLNPKHQSLRVGAKMEQTKAAKTTTTTTTTTTTISGGALQLGPDRRALMAGRARHERHSCLSKSRAPQFGR